MIPFMKCHAHLNECFYLSKGPECLQDLISADVKQFKHACTSAVLMHASPAQCLALFYTTTVQTEHPDLQ